MFLAIVFGVYPNCVLQYMQPSVDRQVDQLAAWTQRYDERETATKSLTEEDGQVAVAKRP